MSSLGQMHREDEVQRRLTWAIVFMTGWLGMIHILATFYGLGYPLDSATMRPVMWGMGSPEIMVAGSAIAVVWAALHVITLKGRRYRWRQRICKGALLAGAVGSLVYSLSVRHLAEFASVELRLKLAQARQELETAPEHHRRDIQEWIDKMERPLAESGR